MKSVLRIAISIIVVLSAAITVLAQEEQPKSVEQSKRVQLPKAMAKWFESLDKNSDGRISKAEAGDLKAFAKMDANGNGFVTTREAVRYAQSRRARKSNDSNASVVADDRSSV